MTNRTQLELEFPGVKRRKVQASFTGGEVTSDGGVLLVRQVDKKLELTKAVARALDDGRRKKSCTHSLLNLLRQGVYGLCLGYEDLNDHDELRQDMGLQTAVERDEPLASASTLCRWENRAGREAAWAIHEVFVEKFVASFDQAPKELILDFDATDDPVHGKQEGRFFHGFYDHYCFLPLYVFCGEHLLVSYLSLSRPGKRKTDHPLLRRLRQLGKRETAQAARRGADPHRAGAGDLFRGFQAQSGTAYPESVRSFTPGLRPLPEDSYSQLPALEEGDYSQAPPAHWDC